MRPHGFRTVDAAGRQLVNEIQTARLKVESAAMKKAITKLRQLDDLAFNRRIADLYREVDEDAAVELVALRDEGWTGARGAQRPRPARRGPAPSLTR
jgi:hypothetical protein